LHDNCGGIVQMLRESNYKKSDFANGKKISHILDFNKGTFQIFNNDNQLIGSSNKNMRGLKVVPFQHIKWKNLQLTLTEQTYIPNK